MKVTRFECSSAERLAQVLAEDPSAPYRIHRGRIGNARYDQWAAERGVRLLSNSATAYETGSGAIGWRRLEWDSNMLGFPAAKLDVLAVGGGYAETRAVAFALIQKAIEDATTAQIRHLTARIDASSLALAHSLADQGFELIDGIQTFALSLLACSELASPDARQNTRLATAADTEQIAEIARSNFVHDRFHNDPSIGTDTANRVHEAWARNSVTGNAADAVLVGFSDERESAGSIEAFVTVKIDSESEAALGLRIATIPLVASGLECRGKGSARRSTEAALAWCRVQEVDIVEVGTQISNVPAARLYQSAGFRTTAILLTYRKLIE